MDLISNYFEQRPYTPSVISLADVYFPRRSRAYTGFMIIYMAFIYIALVVTTIFTIQMLILNR